MSVETVYDPCICWHGWDTLRECSLAVGHTLCGCHFPPSMLVLPGRPNIAVCGVPGYVTVGQERGGALVCGNTSRVGSSMKEYL